MSSDHTIIIRQEALLPAGFKIFGGMMICMGGTLSFIQFNLLLENFAFLGILFILIGLVLIAGGLVLITAHYRLTIDPMNKTYHIYPWLLGYIPGKPTSFKLIEKFYINGVKQSQNYHRRSGSVSSVHSYTHKAFMLLDNGGKIHLDTDDDLEKLEARVASYQQQLRASLRANSTQE
jgi:hypothetical protein